MVTAKTVEDSPGFIVSSDDHQKWVHKQKQTTIKTKQCALFSSFLQIVSLPSKIPNSDSTTVPRCSNVPFHTPCKHPLPAALQERERMCVCGISSHCLRPHMGSPSHTIVPLLLPFNELTNKHSNTSNTLWKQSGKPSQSRSRFGTSDQDWVSHLAMTAYIKQKSPQNFSNFTCKSSLVDSPK